MVEANDELQNKQTCRDVERKKNFSIKPISIVRKERDR
jgi:hypothetical protein